MKKDFTQENFEDYLKQHADSLRMKAPDRVWKNLSKELGKRRRRFAAGLGTLLLVGSAVGYGIISQLADVSVPVPQPSLTQPSETSPNSKPLPSATTTTKDASSARPPAEAPVISLATSYIPRSSEMGPTDGARLIDFSTAVSRIGQQQVAESHTALPLLFAPTVVDSYTEFDERKRQPSTPPLAGAATDFPLSVESVVNSFRNRKRNRFELQAYATPTISYRKLTENKSYLRTIDPSALPSNYPGLYSNVNSNVTHRPDVGFELGLTGKYALTRHLKLRSGLQFNVNRYNISAFNAGRSQATIALNTRGARPDTINTYSPYRNIPGYQSNWLQNLSFQLSTPVGLEYHFAGHNNVQFGMATTIQPTYILGDRAYLITNDYKSYTQVPWLIRRWNVNTAFETFVTVQGEKTRWQIGPQVRYQLLSSFISKYPVKENLFDFGLKFGVSLNNR